MDWDDLFYVAMMFVFVIVAAAFVVGCDKIIGPDDAASEEYKRDNAAPDLLAPGHREVAA